MSIDVTKHHTPKSLTDKVAFRAVKFLRVLSDMYFKVCATAMYNKDSFFGLKLVINIYNVFVLD